MIPIGTLSAIILALSLVLVAILATKAEMKAASKKAGRAAAASKGMRTIGIYKDHIKIGKATMVAGAITVPFLECYADRGTGAITPFDYVLPRDQHKAWISGMGWPDRVEKFLRGATVNLTGMGAPEGITPGSGASVSGKIIVAGSVVHVIGKTKVIEKLTRGLPIRP